jgi:hypothetical protein
MPETRSINVHLSAIDQSSIPSGEEKRRAVDLVVNRECPHCRATISLTDAISMVQGDGMERWVQVQIADGRIVHMPISGVNPQSMRVVEQP